MTRKGAPTLAASLREAIKAAKDAGHGMSFRQFLESKDFCGLALSPIMAAISDASDGRPITTIDAALAHRLFNCPPDALPKTPSRVVCVSAGGRSGKSSRLLAPRAIFHAWYGPLRFPGAPADPNYPLAQPIAKGEHPVSIIVAPRRKLAQQTFAFVRGYIEESPILSKAVVGEPTGEKITLRRPDGILVDIIVIAADRGGASARGKTILFFGMDESAFFYDRTAVISDDDIYNAAVQRVVPYGSIWIVSTPWVEGVGLLEKFIDSDWGTHKNALVVARVSTRLLNPTWDPDHSIEKRERARPGGGLNADREINAIPFARGTHSFFPEDAIEAALNLNKPHDQAEETGAGADLGHGHDNSALVIASRYPGGLFAPISILEIQSGPSQKPSATYEAFGRRLVEVGVSAVAADTAYKANFVEALDRFGIAFIDAASKDRVYKALRDLLTEKRLCLGSLTEDDKENLAEQLKSITAKPLSGGKLQITAPRRKVADMTGAVMGGHCDSVSALTLALWRVGSCDPSAWTDQETFALPEFEDEPSPPGAGFLEDDDVRGMIPDLYEDRGFDRDGLRWD